jgi:hypothetical protein
MALTSRAMLAIHLRDALENWQAGPLSGPWEDLVEDLSTAIDDGKLELGQAARLDHLLRRTCEPEGRDGCSVCDCPIPGVSHPVFGGCPDLRLHDRSDDGKCRYCR